MSIGDEQTPLSPYLYTYSNDNEYHFVSDFIPGANSREKEFRQYIDITDKAEVVDSRIQLKITEELQETTYLDRLYLRVDGSRIIELDFIRKNDYKLFGESLFDKIRLRHHDNIYLVMNEGDEYYLEFRVPTGCDKNSKLEFIAEGYYIEHYKSVLSHL